MTTAKEQTERLEAQLVKAREFQALCDRLTIPHIPDDASYSPHVYKADVQISWKVETLHEAMLAAEKISPAQMVRFKDSCLSFVPESSLTPDEVEKWKQGRIDVRPVCWTYKVDQWGKIFHFCAESDGIVASIKIEVLNDPDTFITFRKAHREGRDHIPTVDELTNKSGNFTHVDRFWHTPDNPAPRVLWA